VKNLAHSASLQLLDKIAPSKFGIKHLGLDSEWGIVTSSKYRRTGRPRPDPQPIDFI